MNSRDQDLIVLSREAKHCFDDVDDGRKSGSERFGIWEIKRIIEERSILITNISIHLTALSILTLALSWQRLRWETITSLPSWKI